MLNIKPKSIEIRLKRMRSGLTQKKLAQLSGVNSLTVLKIENGLTSPNPSTAAKICKALECEFDELFEFKEN